MSDPQYVPLSTVLLPPISGKRPAGGVSSETDGVPSIGGENILSNGGMTYEELKRIPYSFLKFMPKGRLLRDDVLINKDGAQTGKVGFYGGDFEEAAVNEHVFILRSRDQNLLDQRYLYYCVLLPETRNKIERRITGSAQPGLNSQFVKAVDIPFQGLTQQKKIATILSGIHTGIRSHATIHPSQTTGVRTRQCNRVQVLIAKRFFVAGQKAGHQQRQDGGHGTGMRRRLKHGTLPA